LISTDGSGTSSGPGGWAAVLRWGDAVREISGGMEEATNNRAELTAVIMALNTLKRPCEVVLTTDSEYVQKGILDWLPAWRKFGWKNREGDPVKNQDLWQEISHQIGRHRSVVVKWVKGHSGDPDNERADKLAGAERKKVKESLQDA
jgi:ribonuclease HI